MKKNSLLRCQTIYLEALNQIFAQLRIEDPLLKRSELFTELIENQILEANGFPTQKAIDEGYIKIYLEQEDMTFEEFTQLFSVFKLFDKKHFDLVHGYWEIDEFLYDRIKELIDKNIFSEDHLYQLTIYFDERNLN